MTTGYRIQYLPHKAIDKTRWDACIEAAPGGLIYNCSWYLDCMAEHWDALVLNDYEAVMPLIWKKKYGIHYLYQPFFTAHSGITGGSTDPALTDAFISAIPAHFRFIDIDLNEKNTISALAASCRQRVNMLLDTTGNYADVAKEYHRLAIRTIKKVATEQLEVIVDAPIPESILFYRQHYNPEITIQQQVYKKVINMFRMAHAKNQVLSLAAKKNGQLLGMYLLLKDKNFVYSVIGGSSAEGKQKGAFYLLTDYAIKTVSGAGVLFRFEGSDIPGIAAFNQQFGAQPFYYPHLKINRLPFPLKLFKK